MRSQVYGVGSVSPMYAIAEAFIGGCHAKNIKELINTVAECETKTLRFFITLFVARTPQVVHVC